MKRERIWQLGVAIALVVLVAWSFWSRWRVLSASPFPLGVDGYFYPIQLRALLEDGALQYPSSPLTFWFMLPFAAATDPIVGAKLGAALGGALIAVPAYGVGARFGRSRGAGLVAAALAATSASSLYLSLEFVKQGFGLTVALAALWLVLRALDTPSRARIAAAIAGIGAALLAHKLAAGVVIAIAVPAAIDEARGRGKLRGRRLLYLLALSVVAAVVLLGLGLAFPERFLSPADLALLSGLFSSDAHVSAPALVTPQRTLAFEHDAAIGALLAVIAAVALRMRPALPRKYGERRAMWIVVALGIAIGLPWLAVDDPQGLGFRLRLAAFVPLALCAAIVVGAAARSFARLKDRERDAALVVIALVLAIRPHARPTEGMVLAHPALVSAVIASTSHIPAGATVIVPERHILFMTAWYTRANVRLRPERVPRHERMRMMPLAFIGMGSPLEAALDRARDEPGVEPPIGTHPRHPNGLVLVTEPTWEWLLDQLPPAARAQWERWPTI